MEAGDTLLSVHSLIGDQCLAVMGELLRQCVSKVPMLHNPGDVQTNMASIEACVFAVRSISEGRIITLPYFDISNKQQTRNRKAGR